MTPRPVQALRLCALLSALLLCVPVWGSPLSAGPGTTSPGSPGTRRSVPASISDRLIDVTKRRGSIENDDNRQDDLFIDDEPDGPVHAPADNGPGHGRGEVQEDRAVHEGRGEVQDDGLGSGVQPTPSTFSDGESISAHQEGSGEQRSGLSKCQELRSRGLSGQQVFYTPVCDERGDFRPLQCSDDQCWCVDTGGRVIQYTRKRIEDAIPSCVRKARVDTVDTGDTGVQVKSEVRYEIQSTVNPSTPVLPTAGEQRSAVWILLRADVLAGISVGVGVGLFCSIVLVICIVHRMKKKDEGSYALEEPRPEPCPQAYQRAPTKEVYA